MSTSPLMASNFKLSKPIRITAGAIRFPYSLQPGDKDNVYFESFSHTELPFWTAGKSQVSIFTRIFYSADSEAQTFNNRSKVSVGLTYAIKLHKTFTVKTSLKYDYDFGTLTGETKTGIRANFSYFYYKSWWRNMPGDQKGFFRQKSWTRAWGIFTFPENLDPGNKNLAFITGLEAATAFVWPAVKLQYVPFAELTFAKDSDKLSFNNKIIPAVGFKFQLPIKGGQINLGVKYAIDRRWILGTTEYGPLIFGGWYKTF